MTATIVLHLPAHRATALKLQPQEPEAARAYDRNIAGYLEFLKDEAQRAGYAVAADQKDFGPVFSIEEDDHASKRAAHAWLGNLPDIWNWMPAATPR
ncbi:hypothetical protein C3942_15300 [Solimonas fluminis]|uniref:Uncharacterized protein n=1 Tax=Solimonas fluminis TaxID=2086571 RepID=A0A2S5TE31_9GAMM|nr:hypothetical protein [Solimonas fluminis]PPE73182.1 hypothetical protein C3942_15300 [Solimonas fluminis]